jgi:hypothetical protein
LLAEFLVSRVVAPDPSCDASCEKKTTANDPEHRKTLWAIAFCANAALKLQSSALPGRIIDKLIQGRFCLNRLEGRCRIA